MRFLYLNWLIAAKPLRRYSFAAGNAITVPDFLSNRFHEKKKVIMAIASVFILVFFAVYAGSCFVTCGKLFSKLFGQNYQLMMVVGALFVLLYTFLGGFLAKSAFDFIQAIVMIIALVLVLTLGVSAAGGFHAVLENARQIPGFFDFFFTATPQVDANGVQQLTAAGQPFFGDAQPYPLLTILSDLAWGLGYFGMPQVLLRFIAIRRTRELTQSRRIATVWVVISLFAAICIGLIGRVVIPTEFGTESSAENVLIVLSQMLLPAFMCGLAVSGILAASMSSSSAYLLIAGSSVAENIFHAVFKKDATERQVMIVARITLICVFLFGIWVAWDENSSIFRVVSYAWAGLGAAFGPLTLFSLYWRRTTKQGVIAGMLTGAITVLVWHNFIKPLGGIFGIYELLPAFVLGCLAIFIVSKLTPEPDASILEEFDHYRDDRAPKAAEQA